MDRPLRVGIIGLGRRWRQRYLPALLALRRHFEIRALGDQIQLRANREARRLGCQAAGPAAMLESGDIDADFLLLDSQWYRLWPLELACRAGKPVYCACPLELDEAHADSLHQQVRHSRLPVMVEMAPRMAPATIRLREVLDNDIGPPRLLLCESVHPLTEPGPVNPDPAAGDLPGLALMDWGASLLGGQPVDVLAGGNQALGFTNLLLEFTEDRLIQITRRRAPNARRCLSLKVVAERGSAAVELPDRVRWVAADGRHAHTLRGQPPLGQILLERFHEAVTGGLPPRPSLEDAYRLLEWRRAARRSLDEGKRVELTSEQGS